MFLVDQVIFSDDGYCSILSLADSRQNERIYFIIQMMNNPSQKDFDLELAGIHFECCGDNISDYDLITSISLNDATLIINLNCTILLQNNSIDKIQIELPKILNFDIGGVVEKFSKRLSDLK
jgi:hypothetical protein